MDWIDNLTAVIGLLVIVTGIIGGFWKMILGFKSDLKGYGERLTKNETTCTTTSTNAQQLRADMDTSALDRRAIHSDLGELKGRADAMREEIRDDRMAVMTMLHNSEKAAAERDANLQVELARLKERMDMSALVSTIVKEIRKHE